MGEFFVYKSIFRLTIAKMEVLCFVLALLFGRCMPVSLLQGGGLFCVIDTVFKLFLLHFGY